MTIYSTDDFGNPNGWDDVNQQYVHGQLWRTRLGGIWYGLGVLSGLPFQSLASPPLNAPDFSIEIPLVEGENDFTLVGEPGPLTETDRYDRFALNLYFDGMLDRPGISVLFPRHASKRGDPPTPNRSDNIYALSLAPVQVAPETSYSDGADTVTVSAVTFLPPQSFGVDIDLVSPEAPVPNGTSDWIGVVKINVEGPAPAAAPYVPPAPAAFGVVPGKAIVGPDVLGPPPPRNPLEEPAPSGDPRQAAIAAAEPGAETPAPHETATSPAPAGTTAPPPALTPGSPTAAPQLTPGSPGTPSHTTPTPGSTHTLGTPGRTAARAEASASPRPARRKE